MRLFEVTSRSLHHGTSRSAAEAAIKDGLAAPSWWGKSTIAAYYADEFDDRAIIVLPMSRFDPSRFRPDMNSVEEPITTVLKRSEKALWTAWERSEQTWRDSLRLYGSVIYDAPLTVTEADCTFLAPPERLPPPERVLDAYRRLIADRADGTASALDLDTIAYIEKTFDVRK